MKLGIIRCAQTEDFCPGTADFKTIQAKAGAFAGVTEPIELIGFVSCGGCPGKKAVLRAKELVKHGADTIAFASCIKKGTPIGFPCPMAQPMMQAVKKAGGRGLRARWLQGESVGGKAEEIENVEEAPGNSPGLSLYPVPALLPGIKPFSPPAMPEGKTHDGKSC